MTIMTAYSNETSATDAVGLIKEQLGDGPFSLVLYFASSSYDQEALSSAMKKAYPDTLLAGCSTSGELYTGKMSKNSVVAMGLSDSVTGDLALATLPNISKTDDLSEADRKFGAHFNEPFENMDPVSYVGIILLDGLRGAEERIMDKLGDLTNVPFVGGSAGDDLKFDITYVYADGQVLTDAAVLILMKPKTDFSILKTQSFTCLDKILTVTKADEATRTVIEFNNKPAVTAYAEAVGCPESDIDDFFMKNPLGLMVGEEPYVRSPMKVDGSNIVFYCNILEGMELSLLESGDIVNKTQHDLNNTHTDLGSISGLINFHCILRTLELESQNKTKEYGEVFNAIPTIGFSTYGEEYIGHINQTSTMLIFK